MSDNNTQDIVVSEEAITDNSTKPDKTEQIRAAKKRYYEANKERNKEVSRLSSKLYYWRNKQKKDPDNTEKYQKMIDEITAFLGEARNKRSNTTNTEEKARSENLHIVSSDGEDSKKTEEKVEEETKIIDEEVINLLEQPDEKDPVSQ